MQGSVCVWTSFSECESSFTSIRSIRKVVSCWFLLSALQFKGLQNGIVRRRTRLVIARPDSKNQQRKTNNYFPKISSNFGSSSFARIPFARIFPSLSTSTVYGILLAPYSCAAALFQKPRSLTCFHGRPSSLIAFFHDSRSLSNETPRISNPFLWKRS